MAEGLSRDDAVARARRMVGDDEDGGEILLPQSELPLIRLLLAARGQWRMAGGGMAGSFRVAFDLGAVDVAARWLGLMPSPAMLRGLSIVESEALKLMRSQP